MKIALLVIAIASVAANIVLIKALNDSFAKIHFARIFPLGYSDKPSAPQAIANPNGASIAFWGDSRSLSWAGTSPSQSDAVLNFAHGSQTSAQLLLQLKTQPIPHSQFAIVQIGINDLHPLGALPMQQERARQQLAENIISIRDTLLLHSDIVVLTTIIPPGPVPYARRASWESATLDRIGAVNELIRKACDGKQVILLDAHALLADKNSYLDQRYADGDFFLHVNEAAYSRLNEKLRSILVQAKPRS